MKSKSKKLASNSMDIVQLAHHLRQEHLFIQSERTLIQKLHSKITLSSEKLFHLGWIVHQQRSLVDKLMTSPDDQESLPAIFCALDTASFIESHKRLGNHNSKYGLLLQTLRRDPKLVTLALTSSSLNGRQVSPSIVNIIVSSLFGDCLVSEDRQLVLQFLQQLIELQLAANENPRRLLRHGTCAFSRVYQLFLSTLSESRIFLVSALKEPIISVLAEDDLYLDIEVERAVVRFPLDERIRHFGIEGSSNYNERLESYRIWAIDKLSGLVMKFVECIKESAFCFPEGLIWVLKNLSESLTKSGKLNSREIGAICADLIFRQFICSAVMDPDAAGIVDMHITAIARFNLMQVAQVLNTLVMSKFEDVDPKMKDVCDKFPENCLSSVLDTILNDTIPEPPLIHESTNRDICRPFILITENHLLSLVDFLLDISLTSTNQELKSRLDSLLAGIPKPDKSQITNQLIKTVTKKVATTKSNSRRSKSSIESSESENSDIVEVLVVLLENDHILPGLVSEDKVLEAEQQRRQTKVRMNLDSCNDETESVISGSVISEKDGNEKRTRFSQDQESIGTSDNLEVISEAASNHSVASSLDIENENENDNLSDMVSANVSSGRGTPNVSGRETPSSHSSDDEQRNEINNQEVNPDQGAVAACHNQNSNRHSASADRNVQIRGLNAIPVEPPGRSGTRNDIEEKFGKFDCKPSAPSMDETKSLLSDTWSTDVLASDTEGFDTNVDPTAAGTQAANLNFIHNQALQVQHLLQSGVESVETASQSDAWSTDVLTSDTERLQEFDLDDAGSITRSEDLGQPRSEADFEEAFGAAGNSSNSSVQNRLAFEDDFSQNCSLRGSQPSLREAKVPTVATKASNSEVRENRISSTSSSVEPYSLDMQTLGRLSFGIRQKNMTNEEAVDRILPLLKDGQDGERRTSITELLSLDFMDTSSSEKNKKSNDEKPTLNLIDFEMEIASSEGVDISQLSPDVPSSNSQVITVIDVDEERKIEEEKSHNVPTASTGAIPKSSRGGFFKLPNIRSKLSEKMKSFKDRRSSNSSSHHHQFYRSIDDPKSNDGDNDHGVESSDDILEKYRNKNGNTSKSSEKRESINSEDEEHSQDAVMDKATAFNNMKRKIRRVLSNAEVNFLPFSFMDNEERNSKKDIDLLKFLKVLITEARAKKQSEFVALGEAIRCVESLDAKECQRLFWSIREDFQRRSPYLGYLLKSKQTLLMTDSHFEVLLDYLTQERIICRQNLVTFMVRQFLEKKEKPVASFIQYFQNMNLADEKAQLVEKFLLFLNKSLAKESFYKSMSDEQIELARFVIERSVMSQVYVLALFPNGDGDLLRDQILSRHMSQLSLHLTPGHKDLRIPKMYHSEAPWPAAQREILTMNALKTPREKVECIVRTCCIIMNLLSLASERSVPAADDLTPVLVYVLVKANPPNLLSTIQYVDCFYEKQLEGEESYWWTQFCSVVEFIKTMD